MRKVVWKRWMALAIMLALAFSLIPLGGEEHTAYAAGSYGRVTVNGTRVRKQPGNDKDYWFKLDTGFVCTVLGTESEDGFTWYKVNTQHPDQSKTNTYTGYIRSDCFTLLTEEEAVAWEANPIQVTWATAAATATPTPTPAAASSVASAAATASQTAAETSYGLGRITNGEVNFRETEGGAVIQKLDRDTLVEVLATPAAIDTSHWYKVRYNGSTGYIQAPYLQLMGTSVTATPTVATGNYVKLILSSANLRESPGGTIRAQWEVTGQILPIVGSTVQKSGYTWYPISMNNTTYYVRGDCVEVVSSQSGSVTATPASAATTATPVAASGYVLTTKSNVNQRQSPAGKTVKQIKKNVVLPYSSITTSSGYTWYLVEYDGTWGYVRGDCVTLSDQSGAVITATATAAATSTAAAATATPTVTATAATAASGYVRTTKKNVNMRQSPAGKTFKQIDKDLILPYNSVTTASGYTWYLVQEDGDWGYIRSDCVTLVDQSGTAVTAAPTAAATAAAATAATTSSYGYVKLVLDSVNLRSKPAGTRLEQLDQGLVLPLTGTAIQSGNYTWYPVKAPSGRTGYVRGDCASPCDQSGNLTGSATATASTGTTASSYGYVMITAPKTNLRKTAAGTVIGSVDDDTVWPMTGTVTTSKGYSWYPILVNGTAGYVRGDCAFQLSATQQASYLAGNGVPEESSSTASTTATSYLITTADKVNLRASASKDSTARYNVALGTVMAYSSSSTVGGTLWYHVVYSNTEVWVMGNYVKVMTEAEYQAWLVTNPTATPQASVVAGYVITTTSGVNLRSTANGTKILGRLDKGVVMPYSAEPTTLRGYLWYPVTTSLGTGYVRGDCVEECNSDGSALPTATPGATASASTSGQEASYKTLKLGSSGTAVKAMVAELKNQGYYTGSITSSFTSAVQSAVKSFQRAKGLTVDGIAGPNTLHALFGTVPVGQGDSSNLTMDIYPAEKIDWYTGGIQSLWPKGANFKVYDVKTGIVWWAHRWSGGSHIDAEPLTAADTARLCKIYGVSSADEIASKNLWQRRPMLVTIGTRTFACSLYGIPHNYPDGDTISNNDFKGQLCIHFTNSKTHTSNKVDSYHTEAIEYAWENAPNGHK